MEELVEEVLLRFPPDDPATLFRAALVCKDWRRLVSGAGFRRRLRELHRTPPLLGFLFSVGRFPCGVHESTRFVPTSAFRPPHAIVPTWRPLDALHGRILFCDTDATACWYTRRELIVWNPIDGEVRRLPMSPLFMDTWGAALLCVAAGCDGHLDRVPFRVAVVATEPFDGLTSACVYSSEQDAWGQPVSVQLPGVGAIRGPGALVGDALHFLCIPKAILKLDLGKKKLSVIGLPSSCKDSAIVLMRTEGGKLGFTMVQGSKLCLWSDDASRDGDVRWTQQRVIELDKLLPGCDLSVKHRVSAIADSIGVILIHIYLMGTSLLI
ncbi:hypothetical protein ACP70R_015135 [Stipagrostis hirtigluma subsp. patula]